VAASGAWLSTLFCVVSALQEEKGNEKLIYFVASQSTVIVTYQITPNKQEKILK
jgi:hypothetical protein